MRKLLRLLLRAGALLVVAGIGYVWFGPVAVKSRLTRSSWAGGPGFFPFLPRFFPNTDHQPFAAQ